VKQIRSRDSSASIVTSLWAERQRNHRFLTEPTDCSLLHIVHIGSGAHPASIPGSRSAGSWSWRLTSTRVEVKNSWSYTFSPSYVFMTCFIKHRDNFHLVTVNHRQKYCVCCAHWHNCATTVQNIVTYTPIARQRLGKHISVEGDWEEMARN
jgi:hypothetical protein